MNWELTREEEIHYSIFIWHNLLLLMKKILSACSLPMQSEKQ